MHPDAGPVPDVLKPAFDNVHQRIQKIEATAAAGPLDADVADLMKRFVADATRNRSSTRSDHEPRDEDRT
jgi:hypothetical protein